MVVRLGRRAVIVIAVMSVAFAGAFGATGPRAIASDPGFRVGVGVADITPPAFDRTADAEAFPLCPRAAFDGRRDFALQEPYRDDRHQGRYREGDPYCDANHNGRYDGLYDSGGVDVIIRTVHDPIDVRAVAVSASDATGRERTVVIESVVSQGLFEGYSRRIRAAVRAARPVSDVVVSSNHNESSPDPIGIYGGPSVEGDFGAHSGVDDYYMNFLVARATRAAVEAYDARRPATISVGQFAVPASVRVRISDNFPTTGPNATPAALDPKLGVLVARATGDGTPIVTLMSLAAHNQEIGHSDDPTTASAVSSDWPGAFAREVERQAGGRAVFLVGDNGSIEDPYTVVPETHGAGCPSGCFAQAEATGRALADAVVADAAATTPIAVGPVAVHRAVFEVPLENMLFKAAVVGRIFAKRHAFFHGHELPEGVPGNLRTSVAVVDVGPDLQLLANPGEAFPALMLGSPWSVTDASCPDRLNPPVPTWHARARWRFQVGLADDMIGYLIPPWGFATEPGFFLTTCTTDMHEVDGAGHHHKLETESAGPTSALLVARQLTRLLDAEPGSAPCARVAVGRFLVAGHRSASAVGADGVWLAGANGGTTRSGPSFAGYAFIDFDGQPQTGPDATTRGVIAPDGCRTYIDVYPTAPGG